MDLLGVLVETFGPFLIPVTVFSVGAVGYAVLLAFNRARGVDETSKWRSEGEEESEDR